MINEVCLSSPDDQHVWIRRRDGKECAFCGARQFGSSELSEHERQRIHDVGMTFTMIAIDEDLERQ